ncbi:MAG TPA: hypothetical protein VJB15_09025, partial [Rhodothermia bacterium]|nr:hypothetical protein [Rhodothermia bacterium]
MNRYLLMVLIVIALGFPAMIARAQTSEESFWSKNRFLYRFEFVERAGVVEHLGIYEITSGDIPVGSGGWIVSILGPQGIEISRQAFDLSSGRAVVSVGYQPSGTAARVLNPLGTVVATISLEGSRICNQDGYCDGDAGEVS